MVTESDGLPRATMLAHLHAVTVVEGHVSGGNEGVTALAGEPNHGAILKHIEASNGFPGPRANDSRLTKLLTNLEVCDLANIHHENSFLLYSQYHRGMTSSYLKVTTESNRGGPC
jgi:hypothetical protein